MRGDKCPTCGTYLDGLGHCLNADLHSLWMMRHAGVPRPLPPDQITPLGPDVGIYEGCGGAADSRARDERARRRRGALRRFFDAMRFGGRR